jgi:hypothetical protein
VKIYEKKSDKRHCLTREEDTDMLSRNVCNQVPIYAALHPRRAKNSFTPRWKHGIKETIGVLNSHEILFTRETRWRCWLRHCAIIRKVAGSIPDGHSTSIHNTDFTYNIHQHISSLRGTQELPEGGNKLPKHVEAQSRMCD